MKTMKPSLMDDRINAAYIGQENDSGVLLYNKFAKKGCGSQRYHPRDKSFKVRQPIIKLLIKARTSSQK